MLGFTGKEFAHPATTTCEIIKSGLNYYSFAKQSIVQTHGVPCRLPSPAWVAELVDARDLKSLGVYPRAGSSPALGTNEIVFSFRFSVLSKEFSDYRLSFPLGGERFKNR